MTRNRTKRSVAAAACLALLATAISVNSAAAYGLSGVGGRMGSVDPDGWSDGLALGAQLEFEQADSRVHLQPGFIYWSNDGLSDFNPNFDVYYHFGSPVQVSPYVGGGAALHAYSFDGPGNPGTDVGANLFAGVVFPSSAARFFVEGRYAATDRSQASIMGGVTVPLAGGR